MRRKWMALLLAASMVFTFGACGTSSDTPAQESTASVDSNNSDTQEEPSAETSGSEVPETEKEMNQIESYTIENFPIIYQMPELPTGCEITAATMVLNHYGFQTDKENLAIQYLPKLDSADFYYGEDGRLYGNDLNNFFIGDPRTESGIICGTGAIVTALNIYLKEKQSNIQAVDITVK